MYATPESLPRLTAAEYLDWETQQDMRHELVDGYLYAWTGASLRHDEIAMNLAAALHAHLSGGPCRVYKSDIKVQSQIIFIIQILLFVVMTVIQHRMNIRWLI